jgi:hypothetical protein
VWDQPDALGWGVPRRPGLDAGGLFAALSLAQPAIESARRLAPHLRRIGAQRLLIGGALAAGAVAAGELALRAQAANTSRGAPQGGALSPLLANIYLHPFDLAMSSHGMRLVRFMDDLVVMCATHEDAERALELISRQLAALRLQLSPTKTRVMAYADGLEFLGQSLAPRRSGPRLGEGLASFEEAERALREVSRKAGDHARAGTERVRQGAAAMHQRIRRKS